MATTKGTKAPAKKNRYNELREMLEGRRRELMNEVQGRIRDVRADGSKDREVYTTRERAPKSTFRKISNSPLFR